MARVLLTGATGFIGRHCLEGLVSQGQEVHAISSQPVEMREKNVSWSQCDLLDREQIAWLLKRIRPSHLLHLAWHVSPGKWASSGSDEQLRWVQGSLELLYQFGRYGGERAVMAGSCTEYDWAYGYCSEFRTPQKPKTVYGACKLALERVVEAYSMDKGISTAWGRVFFLYGPYEAEARLVPSVVRSLLKEEPALCSHGSQIRDFLYVADVSDAFLEILWSDLTGPVNIASGHPVRVKDIVLTIAAKVDRKGVVRFGALPPVGPDDPLVVGDTTRLSSELGWKPKYDLDHGLDRTIEWWKQRVKADESGGVCQKSSY